MKVAERVVMVAIVFVLIGGASWIYFAVQHEQATVRDAVARGDYEQRKDTTSTPVSVEDWQTIYPNTVPITISGVTVEASVADSLVERIQGLSDTPFLPDTVVKLFAFGSPGSHAIWMKDMNYPIDIIWAARDGTIVHAVENIAPETYPESFASPTPAWYVIEAAAGFIEQNDVAVGDTVVLDLSGE